MPCTTNAAHAQHTLIRGCCDKSTCPCPGGSSYSAEQYCPCNETVGNKSLTYGQQVCAILGTVFLRRPVFFNEIGSLFGIIRNDLDFSAVTCGSFDIIIKNVINGEQFTLGTVTDGDYTEADPQPSITPGVYDMCVGSELCGSLQYINI
jgi:hypothetical protein